MRDSGSYHSIDDDTSPAQSPRSSLSQWLRENSKSLVSSNWFRPTARTSAAYYERQQFQGVSPRSSSQQDVEA